MMLSEPIITSTANRRIVEARKLAQRKHREQQGRFLVEGLQLLHMALDGGARPDTVFHCEEQMTGPAAPALLERFRRTPATILRVSPAVMDALAERELAGGLLATFALPAPQLSAVKLVSPALILVLDRLQDPGNLGTLIRTADAVGAAAVVQVEPGVDLYDPKTLRASMGSLFNLPVIRTGDVAALFRWLAERGVRPVGAGTHAGKPWGEGLWQGDVALVLGNEARGLSPDVAAHVHAWAHLPMTGKAESLNVSIAGGVLMYAWLRENWQK
ncbi:MAG: 23S rRNA (uridine(2479)-2'-O)-methyltransferase [Chloroflexi bacterium ADurb.Bin325]|nr:MAG: 23S rRNA (uridine(2479)-2'-O)-methyltransferase [Chloroflexi bacterium ADurb.Bin325]